MRKASLFGIATFIVVAFLVSASVAQTTAFTYQGQLNISGSPANGSYDFEFRLFSVASGGSQLGVTETRSALPVTNGNFTATLDFGSQFPGPPRYLEMTVRPASTGSFTVLAPRQQIYSAPYSIKSVSADLLGGVPAGGFIQNGTTQQASSNFNISGSGTTVGPMSSQQFLLPPTSGAIIPGLAKRDIDHVGLCGVSTPGGTVIACPMEMDLSNVQTGVIITLNSFLNATDRAAFQADVAFNADVTFNNLSTGGSTQLCVRAGNHIGTCGSSLRYKTNIAPFSGNMNIIDRLRPISFDWKDGGMKDIGFAAEDVAKVDPRFVTYNAKGEVEGVKYDRLSVAFVNAFKEQQAAIEEQKNEIARQKDHIEKQDAELQSLKTLVCSQNISADICKPQE